MLKYSLFYYRLDFCTLEWISVPNSSSLRYRMDSFITDMISWLLSGLIYYWIGLFPTKWVSSVEHWPFIIEWIPILKRRFL